MTETVEIKPRYYDPEAQHNEKVPLDDIKPAINGKVQPPPQHAQHIDTRPMWNVICENKMIILIIVIVIILTVLLVYLIFYYEDSTKQKPAQVYNAAGAAPIVQQPNSNAIPNSNTTQAEVQTAQQAASNVSNILPQQVQQTTDADQRKQEIDNLLARTENIQASIDRSILIVPSVAGKSEDEIRELMEDSTSSSSSELVESASEEVGLTLSQLTSMPIDSDRAGLCTEMLSTGRLCKGKAVKHSNKCTRHK